MIRWYQILVELGAAGVNGWYAKGRGMMGVKNEERRNHKKSLEEQMGVCIFAPGFCDYGGF